jgi:hypothetical protein
MLPAITIANSWSDPDKVLKPQSNEERESTGNRLQNAPAG